jgi:hypothetical protein
LEVRDETGRIVLQVRLLADRVQIQGEWWDENGRGVGLVESNDPNRPGALIEIFGPAMTREQAVPIVPLFLYPSESHFGELAK